MLELPPPLLFGRLFGYFSEFIKYIQLYFYSFLGGVDVVNALIYSYINPLMVLSALALLCFSAN